MFSNDIEIRNGDSLTIIDISNNIRINSGQEVEIGNHVWLCAHSSIMKGSKVPSNVIIGNSSVVSVFLADSDSIYAGIPPRLVK